MLANGVARDEIIATRITPQECLVFEDSVPGAEAGRRAGMRVVWVPYEGLRNEYTGREGEVLAGLTGEGKHLDIDVPESKDGEVTVYNSQVVNKGVVLRKVDDGWGEARGSLEGFDFTRYGIIPL